MKMIMICGSPRLQKSTSQYLLNTLKENLSNEHEIIMCNAAGGTDSAEHLIGKHIQDTKAIVLAFPLYIDGIPSSLLQVMKNIELQIKGNKSDCKLYVIVNSGFYDARQNAIAIAMVWKWCKYCGLEKGRAVGLGAGEMAHAAPLGIGPSKNLGRVIKQLTADIRVGNSGEAIFVEPNFPRFLYITAAHIGWRKGIKANGLKAADLKMRLKQNV